MFARDGIDETFTAALVSPRKDFPRRSVRGVVYRWARVCLCTTPDEISVILVKRAVGGSGMCFNFLALDVVY